MATVDQIINRSIDLGNFKAAQAEAYGGQAVNATLGGYIITPGTIESAPDARRPNVNIPRNASGVDTALFDSTYDRIMGDFPDKLADFILEYFPLNPALMNSVENWLQSAINGGTGINANVERQIWQRDRERITNEYQAASDEAIGTWASKGYPMPPGAAVANVASLAVKRAQSVAAVSRDAAIKAFETEIETVKFAVAAAIDYRVKAISAAMDYIRALALAPQLATQLATEASGAQARLISAAASFYNADISVAQLAQQRNIAQTELETKVGIQNSDTAARYVQTRANAAVSISQSLGTQAAAALNAVNATIQKITSE